MVSPSYLTRAILTGTQRPGPRGSGGAVRAKAMAQTTPRVRDGVLADGGAGREHPLRVGSAAWWRWLDLPGTTSFRFEHGAGRFTARRERQRDRWYWYAHRRQGGRLR
jgi:hypothetical protein